MFLAQKFQAEPCTGVGICKAKAATSYSVILRPFNGPITGIEPTTTHSAEESSTDKADPAEVKSIFPTLFVLIFC